jgi:hypothetical protein
MVKIVGATYCFKYFKNFINIIYRTVELKLILFQYNHHLITTGYLQNLDGVLQVLTNNYALGTTLTLGFTPTGYLSRISAISSDT